MDRAALAVQYVFLFTLAAGVMVLLAAIQATRDERMFESAVLRTLGARRSVVLQGVAAEFTALGLLAGTLAAVGAAIDRLRHRDAAVPARLRARHSAVARRARWPARSSSASAARSPCAPSSTIRRSRLCAAPERAARYHSAPSSRTDDDRVVHGSDAERLEGVHHARGARAPLQGAAHRFREARAERAVVSRRSIRTAASRRSSITTTAASPCSSRAR